MEILNLNTNDINQNGYHFNKITKNKIGMIFTAPVDYVPDDCLACDGYVLKIDDYKKLFLAIGKNFNTGNEAEDEFRIPDYNITKRFLQPDSIPGIQIEASLPQHTHSGTASSNGAHTHTRGTMNITGSLKVVDWGAAGVSGAFTRANAGRVGLSGGGGLDNTYGTFSLDASKTWTGATSSNGAHTHTITVGNSSNQIYNNTTGMVQPSSHTVHLCIKYK